MADNLSMVRRPGSVTKAEVIVLDDDTARPARTDELATEEPMETRLLAGGRKQTIAVTMRTPGSDFELAAGFLHGEGVIGERGDIERISYCIDDDVEADQRYNIVNVELRHAVMPDLHTLERHFYTTSACGVCGKASIDSIRLRDCPIPGPGPVLQRDVLYSIPDLLQQRQGLFAATGGLHAAALVSATGELLAVREDVGRHNALDKLIGWALLEGRLPLAHSIVMVSGRSSFEILQKCVVAGVPVVCSVSAPSSLAVDVAKEFGITLVGFLRGRHLNIYSRADRIA
jgi:FdhD protein